MTDSKQYTSNLCLDFYCVYFLLNDEKENYLFKHVVKFKDFKSIVVHEPNGSFNLCNIFNFFNFVKRHGQILLKCNKHLLLDKMR